MPSSTPGRRARRASTPADPDRSSHAHDAEHVGAEDEHPDDERLHRLIADLRATSPRFEELWGRPAVGRRAASRKTFAHPEVGLVTVDCDVLTAQDSDLRLVVYSAAPDSADANAPLGAVGLQTFG